MKAVLLALLMAGLALQPGTALLCYSCKAQVSNEDCLNVENCTQPEEQCWTERIRLPPGRSALVTQIGLQTAPPTLSAAVSMAQHSPPLTLCSGTSSSRKPSLPTPSMT
ncbi:prostate stem cell antigen isoform X2 [Macaca thibetana thibetana]|uniref:prostate stem cell antigen isoform X2 n=1 Tax=Macaca thibetana thibetana TaxID=257877 RepID=UPI0021BC9C6E|nr:prostate stem cell antigen isoform X2 [Macaca thibetana thibetana]